MTRESRPWLSFLIAAKILPLLGVLRRFAWRRRVSELPLLAVNSFDGLRF
jgi:hypothetical protein